MVVYFSFIQALFNAFQLLRNTFTQTDQLVAAVHDVPSLWPFPSSFDHGNTAIKLADNFQFTFDFDNPPSDLVAALARSLHHLRNDKLKPLVVGRAPDPHKLHNAPHLPSLVLRIQGAPRSISEDAVAPLTRRDEAYNMSIPSNGEAGSISATSTLGLFRALTTFEQLWHWDEEERGASGSVYTLYAPISIHDEPAFPYRGFMLDTARNFFPVSDIKRTLDTMSWLNTFHWHVSDAQSFPLSIPGFEEIAQQGAYSPDELYSTSDVEDVIAYAAQRGIDVIVEVDSPGHAAPIGLSYPEHIVCHQATPWARYAASPPAGQFRITSAATREFARKMYGALARQVRSTFLGTGGDEVVLACYDDDGEDADIGRALAEFVNGTHSALKEAGKTPVVWQEMVLDHGLNLINDTVVMVWKNARDARNVIEKGFRVVHASSGYFYLDCGSGGWLGNNVDGKSWCDPFKTWQKAYSFDPLQGLAVEHHSSVLGGQHLLWTEQASPENLDSVVWPRAASGAEVFWTGDRGTASKSALRRLHDIRYRMVRRGVRATPLQPHWCALRVGACNAPSWSSFFY